MAVTTVAQLAAELNRPAATLLEQLKSAGVAKNSPDDSLSESDKERLLDHLRNAHGMGTSGERKKITRESTDGLPLRRWDGLLVALSAVVRNTCRIDEGKIPVHFTRDTEPNAFQSKVFALLKTEAAFWPNLVPSRRNSETETEVTVSC